MITHAQLVNEFCGFDREPCLGELQPCARRLSEVPVNPRDTTQSLEKPMPWSLRSSLHHMREGKLSMTRRYTATPTKRKTGSGYILLLCVEGIIPSL